MNFKYQDLFNKGDFEGHASHRLAHWLIINRGDTVELPDIFSYRNVYFRTILEFASKHAKTIGAVIYAHTAKSTDLYPTGSICLEFRGPNETPEAMLPPASSVGYMGAPKHRGEYYGPEEQRAEPYAPGWGWNLISIPFDKEGEPQEE